MYAPFKLVVNGKHVCCETTAGSGFTDYQIERGPGLKAEIKGQTAIYLVQASAKVQPSLLHK